MPFKTLLCFFWCSYVTQVFAQSDTPCQAPVISVNSDTCIFINSTTAGATYQTDPANGGIPPCAFPGSPDVWYAVIVPSGPYVTLRTIVILNVYICSIPGFPGRWPELLLIGSYCSFVQPDFHLQSQKKWSGTPDGTKQSDTSVWPSCLVYCWFL